MTTLARCGLGLLAAMVLCAAGTSARPLAGALCPIKPGSPSGGDVQWAFTFTGSPTGTRHGVKSSYTHGRGSWTGGSARGTACSTDNVPAGSARDLVLSVSGPATLSPRVSEFGLLGVRLVLHVRVSASDDGACVVHSRGTITLFASYYAVHRDSLKLHFARTCGDHDLSYKGSQLHVLIARHGAQVNRA